jgi:hypothetical protein
MAGAKEQLNVQVSAAIKQRAKTCATARQTSLNAWVEEAIREKAARDAKSLKLDAMNKALNKVAKRYLPGIVVTPAQMLAMAQRVAAEDTTEGFAVERAQTASTPKRKAKPARAGR